MQPQAYIVLHKQTAYTNRLHGSKLTCCMLLHTFCVLTHTVRATKKNARKVWLAVRMLLVLLAPLLSHWHETSQKETTLCLGFFPIFIAIAGREPIGLPSVLSLEPPATTDRSASENWHTLLQSHSSDTATVSMTRNVKMIIHIPCILHQCHLLACAILRLNSSGCTLFYF